MYQNLLPLWRTNEELMITAWEGLGFTNNYNLRRNTYVKGSRHYELSNHTSTLLSAGLGNVLTVVSDRKIEHDERYAFAQGGGYKYENGAYHLDAAGSFAQLSASDGIISHYTAELISATDYYAFGAPMPERTWQGGEYRFGFNGQEKDDEVSDAGNSYTAEFWQYDPRLGRRFNVDPKPNPSISVYAAFANNPIFLIDINGDTVYQFNSNLKYIGFKDDGKVEITGSILNKKGKSVYQFNFNDPANDAAALRNKEITGLQIMSENDFNYAIEKSGVKDKKSKIDAVKYATEEGPAGKAMDYSKYFSGTKLTIFKGGSTAYNKFDAGNFMWGYGMNQLGFSEFTAQWGAEAAAFAWGKKWYPPTFGERGHGEDWDDNAKVWESKWWNQKSWTGDSGADQKAIQEGYRYNKP